LKVPSYSSLNVANNFLAFETLCYFLNFANLLVNSFSFGQLHDSTQSQTSSVLSDLVDLTLC